MEESVRVEQRLSFQPGMGISVSMPSSNASDEKQANEVSYSRDDIAQDYELVERVQRGETTVFRMLVELHQKRIYNLCYRMLQNAEEARDATQETFLKAYRSLGGFRHESSFTTWLCRIAANECINRTRRQDFLSLDDMQEEGRLQLADSAPSPFESVERTEVQSMLRGAIDALPIPYRLAITLYHLNELSYEEIARVMGVPIGTVKTYLFRARATLKSKLERFVEGKQ
jgi:RNA polymerase sigma-70 factor (ECF subfamily)